MREQEMSILQMYYEQMPFVDSSIDPTSDGEKPKWSQLSQSDRDQLETSFGFAAWKFSMVMQGISLLAADLQKMATEADKFLNQFNRKNEQPT